MTFNMFSAAGLYCQTAGLLAGFALTGAVLLIQRAEPHQALRPRRDVALGFMIASCVQLVLTSFLYGEIVGDQPTGLEKLEPADIATLEARVTLLARIAGLIFGISSIEIFVAINALLLAGQCPAPGTAMSGLAVMASEAIATQQVLLLLWSPGHLALAALRQAVLWTGVAIVSVGVVRLVARRLAARGTTRPGPLRWVHDEAARIVCVLCVSSGLLFGAISYSQATSLPEGWELTVYLLLSIAFAASMVLFEISLAASLPTVPLLDIPGHGDALGKPDRPFTIGGAAVEQGLRATTKGHATFDLGRSYRRLNAIVGLPDDTGSIRASRYTIALDGRVVAHGCVQPGGKPRGVTVEVAGGRELCISWDHGIALGDPTLSP